MKDVAVIIYISIVSAWIYKNIKPNYTGGLRVLLAVFISSLINTWLLVVADFISEIIKIIK